MNIQDLIGKRCLLKVSGNSYKSSPIDEYRIVELSPSMLWVKLQNIHGNRFWKSIADLSFVEELQNIEVGK